MASSRSAFPAVGALISPGNHAYCPVVRIERGISAARCSPWSGIFLVSRNDRLRIVELLSGFAAGAYDDPLALLGAV